MLESTYLLISLISFICLVISFFNKKRAARLILQLISVILFGSLAIASTQVEKFQCEGVTTLTNLTNSSYSVSNNTITLYNNDIICEKNSTFDNGGVWINGGMVMISAVIAFLTAINIMSMRQED